MSSWEKKRQVCEQLNDVVFLDFAKGPDLDR